MGRCRRLSTLPDAHLDPRLTQLTPLLSRPEAPDLETVSLERP